MTDRPGRAAGPSPPPPSVTTTWDDLGPAPRGFSPAIALVMKLGAALHAQGAPAHRVEEALDQLCERLGMQGHFFATPTYVLASFEAEGARSMRIVRTAASSVDLGKMAELDAVIRDVGRGLAAVEEAAARVDGIVDRAPRYGRALVVLAFALSAGAAARFFGGGWAEILVAAGIGGLVGVLSEVASWKPGLGRVFEATAAFAGTFLATVAAGAIQPLSVPITTLGGLISLFPGLAVTVAMTELATRNLVSGTARLAGGMVSFLNIAFGVALGSQIGSRLVPALAAGPPAPLPGWAEPAALLVASLSFGVLFRCQARDLGWAVLAGTLAFGGARLGTGLLGPELGTFLGALSVALMGNAYARHLDRPAAVPMVSGIVLLVPGSLGFRSVSSLMAKDVISGVELAFTMALLAASLVAGLLLANVLLPPRKAL